MNTIAYLFKNPLSFVGMLLILLFIIIGVSAPFLCPPPPYQSPYMVPRAGFWPTPRPPSHEHPFGTTQGQYDIYYGVVWGTRTAFEIGLGVVLCSVLIGVVIGSISAFYGGVIDEIMMRITDIFMAFPFMIAAMTLTTVLGKGLDKVMIALIFFGWMTYARLIRSEILHIKETSYVEAARSIGATNWRLITRHILPNSFYPVIVQASLATGTMVITASTLSFLGVGAEPGYADWGQMISYARNWIIGSSGHAFQYWYTVVYPALAIFLFVLAWSLIGDALRDILDPHMRGRKR